MIKSLQIACAGLLLIAMLSSAGCVAYGPGPDGYYDYDYYPDVDVYYYPVGGYYYWNEGGAWHHGRDLPSHYTVHAESRQSFQGHTRQPWTENHSSGGAGHSSGGSGDWHH
ncbi:MAG TPA: hypothetical protein VGI03_11650 [Verrucomicrobiae bacterium]